ncbi:MAG: c-type cytochrome [Pseudohongiellaceae bacterium]
MLHLKPALGRLAVAGFLLAAAGAQAGPGEGQGLYDSFCVVCHGGLGEGQTMGKSLTDSAAKNLDDQELIAVITEGRSGTGMAAWDGSLSDQEILDIAAYVRVLQGGSGLTSVDENAVASDDPAVIAGEELFNGKAGCVTCHSYRDQGGAVGPNLDAVSARLDDAELRHALVEPSANIAAGYEVKEVTLPDGSVIRGRYRNDSELAVQIQSEDGARWVTYFKDRVESITDTDRSLMPDDVFAALTGDEQQKLLAFLKSL